MKWGSNGYIPCKIDLIIKYTEEDIFIFISLISYKVVKLLHMAKESVLIYNNENTSYHWSNKNPRLCFTWKTQTIYLM